MMVALVMIGRVMVILLPRRKAHGLGNEWPFSLPAGGGTLYRSVVSMRRQRGLDPCGLRTGTPAAEWKDEHQQLSNTS